MAPSIAASHESIPHRQARRVWNIREPHVAAGRSTRHVALIAWPQDSQLIRLPRVVAEQYQQQRQVANPVEAHTISQQARVRTSPCTQHPTSPGGKVEERPRRVSCTRVPVYNLGHLPGEEAMEMPEYNNPTAAPPAPVEGGNPTEEEDPAQSLINDLLDASPETLQTLHVLFDVALAVRASVPLAVAPPTPPTLPSREQVQQPRIRRRVAQH